MTNKNKYNPDCVSHPCNTLDEMSANKLFNSMMRDHIDFVGRHIDIMIDHLAKNTKPRLKAFWKNRLLDYYRGGKSNG